MTVLRKRNLFTLTRHAALYIGCMGLTSIITSPLHAEGLDRVYQVQAKVTPSSLVSDTVVPLTALNLKIGPNDRDKTVRVGVEQGNNAYKINLYTLHVHLKPNNNGSNDNGTLIYSLSASAEHNVGSHTTGILPRVRGTIALHNGVGHTTLPKSKYFSGDLDIHAIAASFLN